MRRVASDYEVVQHGLDHPQYFQGCGIALTEFDDIATGSGDTEFEALSEAIEQLDHEWDLSTIRNKLFDDIGTTDVCYECQVISDNENSCDCEILYFVSVRVKE